MKQLGILLSLILLAGSGQVLAAEKFIEVDRNLDVPSFIGWVEDRVVVVLKEDAATQLDQRTLTSRNALSAIPELATLGQQFGVSRAAQQFEGAKLSRTVAASERRLARHFKITFNPTTTTLDEVVAAYEAVDAVEEVQKIGIHTMYATPNDTYYDNPPPEFPYDQWHYWNANSIDADQAWDNQTGSSDVVVGILDSGTRYFHIDLGGNSSQWGPDNPFAGGNIFINPNETPGDGVDNDGNGYVDDVIGYDFVENTDVYIGVSCIDQDCGGRDNDPDDGDGHGTHVSGTVGAITNNARQVAGVAGGYSDGTISGVGNGSRILPCRIGFRAQYRGQATGVVLMDAAAEAMWYISGLIDAGNNVTAINCSWGSSNSGGLAAATDNLINNKDVLVVVAAGNSGNTSQGYLNSRGDCLDVAATDINGDGASFSNYGSWVEVAAPGVDILSTYANPDDPDLTAHYVALLGGTSMSAPHVAGIAALLESCNPALTATDKFNLIVGNVDPYNDTRDLGSGIANAAKALAAAACAQCNETTPVADFSGSPVSGEAPLTVSFTDLSTNNPTSWSWDFGDGGTSTAQNPSYEYTAAGTYSVTLTASNCAGSDVVTKTDYITVTEPVCNETTPVADFSGSPTSGDAPLTVSFTDLSTNNPTSWSWDFGDGGTSTAQNPTYEYTAAGTYTVSLTASNCAGSDLVTKTGYITVTEPAGGTMHVHDIVVTRKNAGPNCNGIGTIYIYDSNEQPVANATVTVDVTGPVPASGSGTTGSDGSVTFETSKTKSCGGEWCFEVTNVTHATLTYDAAANHVTKSCESGDVFSNGNAISTTGVPEGFELSNHPNPFNPTTTISFSLTQPSQVKLEVYNISGQRVSTLVDEFRSAGTYTIEWDGAGMASGVYLYRIETNEGSLTKKMLLIK